MLRSNRAKTTVLVIGGVILLCLIAGLILLRTGTLNASQAADDSLRGIFEGITPCSGVDRPLPQIPEDSNCEQMIWKLALYQEPVTGTPATFQLDAAYGLSQQGTTGLQRGESNVHLDGKWTTLRGTKSNPSAVIYQLNPDDPQNTVYFVQVNDRILHLLTLDKTLMVGNGAWSYTLNRTDASRVSDSAGVDRAAITPEPVAGDAAGAGVFDGRSPCAEIALALYDLSAGDCQRVKWRLTLQASSAADAPATFQLLNVFVGMGDIQYHAAGTWTVLRGTPADPDALVYQLNPDGDQPPLFFLKADDNMLFLLDGDFNFLVGDALASFTLSRSS